MIPKIGITIGDINGIGPEIALKAISEIDLSASIPILISPASVIDFYNSELGLNKSLHKITSVSEAKVGFFNLLVTENLPANIQTGAITKESGFISMKSIALAIDLCKNKELNAMVTLPISKEAVQLAGYDIPGHTEFLAKQTNSDQFLMMLVSGDLRIALITGHIPISNVAASINQDLIISKATILSESLKQDFGISNPRIAVLGSEEKEIIAPAIGKLKESEINVEGPFPADGFFGQKKHLKYDAILAMYHDQGLAPFKLLSFGKGVNFTAGLPIIRTSPDHGTAFDIAGKGISDPSSFIQAYELAVELAQKN
jgi:4-hydroxythreonine-4-phosphate dehydrogenase